MDSTLMWAADVAGGLVGVVVVVALTILTKNYFW